MSTTLPQPRPFLSDTPVTLENVLDQVPTPILCADQLGTLLFLNAAFLETFGYCRAEIGSVGDWWRLAYPEAEIRRRVRSYWLEMLARVIATGTIAPPFETSIRCKDGSTRDVDVHLTILDNSGERNAICIVTLADTTATKAALREAEAARAEAESESRAKSAFLANMSHEFRTPLNAIIGFSELMLLETHGPLGHPVYREYVGDVLTSGQHLLEVVGEILDLAKAEAGAIKIKAEPLDLYDLLAECGRVIAPVAAQGGINVALDVPASIAVSADRVLLKRIILNLLSNAVKFTPVGGRILLWAAPAPDDIVNICVEDTGIGMSEADIETALKPFGQADISVTRRDKGTGLGVPIAKNLVELHNGTFKIDSTPGQGTRICIMLPAAGAGSAG